MQPLTIKNGSKVFIDAMKDELEKRGVKIHYNCMLEKINNKKIITSFGEMIADYFIFCHTPSEVNYSKFITATISYSGTAVIENDVDWGSCFYKEDTQQLFPILSIVNLKKLYTEKTAQYLNLNIKVRDTSPTTISSPDLFKIIQSEIQAHFKDITILEIVNRVDWQKAMPIAGEDFVQATKQARIKRFILRWRFYGLPINGNRIDQR